MMFQLSLNQTKIYAPIFQQGSTLCVSEVNAISEHFRSKFPICSEFGALPRFSERLKALEQSSNQQAGPHPLHQVPPKAQGLEHAQTLIKSVSFIQILLLEPGWIYNSLFSKIFRFCYL